MGSIVRIYAQIKPKSTDATGEVESILAKLTAAVEENEIGNGTRGYDVFRGDDGIFRVLEEYDDPAALMRHLGNLDQGLVGRMSTDLSDLVGLDIMGEPGEEARKAMSALSPRISMPIAGA